MKVLAKQFVFGGPVKPAEIGPFVLTREPDTVSTVVGKDARSDTSGIALHPDGWQCGIFILEVFS